MIDDEYIPDIEFETPCPLCDAPLIHDHFLYCTGCLIRWEPDGTSGKSMSEEAMEDDIDDYG